MQNPLRLPASLAAAMAMLMLAGCTIFPEHKTPTLGTTTSAEQTQRIFWKDVEAGKWTEVNALLAPNVVWRAGNRVLERNEVVPWLQGLGIQTVLVADARLKANVQDITVVYALQLKAHGVAVTSAAPGGATPTTVAAAGTNCLQNLHAVAVWQQSQAGGAGTNKGQSPGPYLLTVEDLALASGAEAGCAGQ